MKRCKGQGKAKGFGCGNKLDYTERSGLKIYKAKYGLGLSCCYPKWLYTSKEGKKMISNSISKVQKPRLELEEAKNDYKNEKSLPRELKLTQIVFNKYIRLRDKGKPCISSGAVWKKDHEAGHLFSVKQYSALRFNEDNCHSQSIGDNRFKEGNFEDYIVNVKHRIGDERLDTLMKLAADSKKTVKKWTINELKEIRKYYKQKTKELKC